MKAKTHSWLLAEEYVDAQLKAMNMKVVGNNTITERAREKLIESMIIAFGPQP